MRDWKKVGQVFVDAGYVVVGDPWNFPADDKWYDRMVPLDNENGEVLPGVIAVKTGLGDGIYDVEVLEKEVPGWGTRVVEMRIVFIEDVDKAADFMNTIAGKGGK